MVKYKHLSQACKFVNERINLDEISINNYISTENMLAEKGGVKKATSLPDAKSVSYFYETDILTSNIRPYFKKIWFATKTGGCSNDVLVLRANKTTDPKFLYYALSDNNFFNYATVTSKGTKMPRGSKSAIMKYLIPDIPLPTQKKIAEILSTYDYLVENNNKRIKLLKKISQEIYKEWFVRMRFSGYNTSKFLDGIPEGWETVRLGDQINITSSKRVFLSDYVENGIPFYRSKEVIQLANGQPISEPIYIDEQKYFEFKDKYGVPKVNDILLTSVGTIGVSILISDDNPFYFKDGNLTWFQSSSNPNFALYLYIWLNSEFGKQQILSSTIGTSQSALTIENLNKNKIIKPSDQVLKEFTELVKPILIEVNNLQTQNRNLVKQRDLILPRLLSGKLEVQL